VIRPAADTDAVPPPPAEDASSREPAGGPTREKPRDHAAAPFKTLVAQAFEYLAHAREATVDLAKAKLAGKLQTAAMAAIGAVAGVALLVTAVVLVLVGLSGALSAWIGETWAGPLITGVLVLAACVIGPLFIFKRMARAATKRIEAKYAARRAAQRERFGTDVAAVAAAAKNASRNRSDDDLGARA
jgi:hypothetical protein